MGISGAMRITAGAATSAAIPVMNLRRPISITGWFLIALDLLRLGGGSSVKRGLSELSQVGRRSNLYAVVADWIAVAVDEDEVLVDRDFDAVDPSARQSGEPGKNFSIHVSSFIMGG